MNTGGGYGDDEVLGGGATIKEAFEKRAFCRDRGCEGKHDVKVGKPWRSSESATRLAPEGSASWSLGADVVLECIRITGVKSTSLGYHEACGRARRPGGAGTHLHSLDWRLEHRSLS